MCLNSIHHDIFTNNKCSVKVKSKIMNCNEYILHLNYEKKNHLQMCTCTWIKLMVSREYLFCFFLSTLVKYIYTCIRYFIIRRIWKIHIIWMRLILEENNKLHVTDKRKYHQIPKLKFQNVFSAKHATK